MEKYGKLSLNYHQIPNTVCVSLIKGEAGQSALESDAKKGVTGGIERKSTRSWAQEIGYDPEKIFNKVSILKTLGKW